MATALIEATVTEEQIKRVNFNTNARSTANEEVIGAFIERDGCVHGLRSRAGSTNKYNRSYIVDWVGKHFAALLYTGDPGDPYKIDELSLESVDTAAQLYRQMLYVDRNYQKTSLYIDAPGQRDWVFIWDYMQAFETAHDIKIPDLVAPQGDRRNLCMVIWMMLEIAARRIEAGEL